MKKAKKCMKIIIALVLVLIVILAAIYINHRIRLNKEEELRTPLGKLVEVNGHQMSIYVEGKGDKTIVFMSGGGTCSPILDFKSLYTRLSDDYKIVVVESDAIRHGTLSDAEKEIYRAVFYEKTATTTMLNEVEYIKENAEKVQNNGVPQVPMLLFVSDGSGTGWNEEVWCEYQNSYLETVANGKLINLDCPHYVHDYEYVRISEEIRRFMEGIS